MYLVWFSYSDLNTIKYIYDWLVSTCYLVLEVLPMGLGRAIVPLVLEQSHICNGLIRLYSFHTHTSISSPAPIASRQSASARHSFNPWDTKLMHLYSQLEQVIQALALSLCLGNSISPDIAANTH